MAALNLRNVNSRTAQVLVLALVSLVAVAEGYEISQNHTKVVLATAGLLVAVWGLSRPLGLLVVALAMLTIAEDPARFRVSRATVPELLIVLGLFFVVLLGEFSIDRIGLLFAVFILAMASGAIVAQGHGVSSHDAFLTSRLVIGFLGYWIARDAFRRYPDWAAKALLWLACIIAFLSVAQELVPSHRLFLDPSGLIVEAQSGGFQRIRPPGTLVYVVAFFTFARLIWGPPTHRRLTIFVAGLLTASILVSLNRNWIVGLALGFTVAFAIGRKDPRSMTRMLAIVGIAVVALGVGAGTAVGNRVLSLGNTKGLEKTTLSDRQYENKIAERVLFHEHRIFGVGWAPYGAQVAVATGGGSFYALVPRPFIHNQFLGIWLRGGILALITFVGALVLAALRAVRTFRRDPRDWIAAGCLAALVGLAASSFVGIYVIDMPSAVTWGILLGLASTLGLRPAPSPVGAP